LRAEKRRAALEAFNGAGRRALNQKLGTHSGVVFAGKPQKTLSASAFLSFLSPLPATFPIIVLRLKFITFALLCQYIQNEVTVKSFCLTLFHNRLTIR
jgi:hypothetical protein